MVFFAVVIAFGDRAPGAGLLAYAVPALGFIASVSGLLASMIVRRARWLLVPLAACVVFAGQFVFILKCCVRLGS